LTLLQNIQYEKSVYHQVKKITSISLSILILAGIMHMSVDMHFCGGKKVAAKMSFTGQLANCGMENSDNPLQSSGTNISKHCCEDKLTIIGTDTNYTPTIYSGPQVYQLVFQYIAIQPDFLYHANTKLRILYANVSPPGVLSSTRVDLSDICTLRI
jgi:hypothetical protein